MNPRVLPFLTTFLLGGLLLAQEPAPGKQPPPGNDPKPARPAALKVGSEVPPDLTLTDVEGKPLRFGELRGRVVVLHFWSTTCPWEEVAEPKLIKMTEELKARKVEVLAIAANKDEIGEAPDPKGFAAQKAEDRPYRALRAHAKKVGLNHRILVDHSGDVARLLQARTTPHCFVVDAEGVLRYQGALDDDGEGRKGDQATRYVRDAVDSLLAGKEPETADTRPYG